MGSATEASNDERRGETRYNPLEEHLVVLTMPDQSQRLERLVDVSPRGLAFLLRHRHQILNIGDKLPAVQFFSSGACTLKAPARVRDLTQVTIEGFGVGFKVGLAFEQDEKALPTRPTLDTYTDPNVLTDAVRNLVQARTQVRICNPNHPDQPAPLARFNAAPADRHAMSLMLLDEASLEPDFVYELQTELYGTRLALYASYVGKKDQRALFSWPSKAVAWRHRGGTRLISQKREVYLSFEAPFSRETITRPVVDVSIQGLAIHSHNEDALVVGMLLPEIRLQLPNKEIRARGVVRNVRSYGDGYLAGIELVNVSSIDSQAIGDYVGAHIHPSVRLAKASDLPQMWALFDHLKLFVRDHAAVSPLSGRLDTVRQALMHRGRSVFAQMVGVQDGQLQGAAEMLRTHPETWTLQHVGVVSDSRLTPDQLVVPLLEHAMQRRDFRYLHTLLNPSEQNFGLTRLDAMQADPRQLSWETVMLLAPGPQVKPLNSTGDIQEATASDQVWVADKLGEHFTPVAREALNLDPPHMNLGELNRTYHGLGLERTRTILLGLSVSGPNGVALMEHMSSGLALSNPSDMTRLFAFERDGQARSDALYGLAVEVMGRHHRAGRSGGVFVVRPDDAELLIARGFQPVGTRVEVTSSREGATQVVNFLSLLGAG